MQNNSQGLSVEIQPVEETTPADVTNGFAAGVVTTT